jgi:hypothetical protein
MSESGSEKRNEVKKRSTSAASAAENGFHLAALINVRGSYYSFATGRSRGQNGPREKADSRERPVSCFISLSFP